MDLVWAVHPFRAEPIKGVSVLLVIGGATYFCFVWGGPILGFLALVVLVGGTGSFFVPIKYRLTPEGVEVDSPFQRLKRPWSYFRRAYVGPSGVSLSPFSGRHLLEPYRSVMLRFDGRRREILDWIVQYGSHLDVEAEMGAS